MNERKLPAILNIIGNNTRYEWIDEKNDYYFSVVDIIEHYTDLNNPRVYWLKLKEKLTNNSSFLSDMIIRRKMKSFDGSEQVEDLIDIVGIFYIIESISSSKAESLKTWLSRLGSNRVNQFFDPSIGIEEAIEIYLSRGYSSEEINRIIYNLRNKKEKVS